MSPALYNEIDPFAAAWMRALIDDGQIAPGVVDERSIAELKPGDVAGPGERHFFAGIGGWSYALRLAGWPTGLSVWTGSCPCQPFSAAGKRGGFDDARHLWPEWFRLIRQCRPPVVLGEQVANPDGLAWFDLVSADLEGAGYAVGAADLCAAGVGAPHLRQRLYFVAYADHESERQRLHVLKGRPLEEVPDADRGGPSGRLANDDDERRQRAERGWLQGAVPQASRRRELGHAGSPRGGRHPRGVSGSQGGGAGARRGHGRLADELGDASAAREPWAAVEWIPCRDGKARPVESGTFPLAHGVPGRVGQLRGYGNAIVSEAATTFVRAVMPLVGAAR